MLACMCVDEMGVGEMTPEDEYDEIEAELKQFLPGKTFTFKRRVLPYKLENQPCDIYVFDFGGMLPGCEDMIASHFRTMVRQIQDRPCTLFILWSAFTERWYTDIIKDEFPELKAPNVIFRSERMESWDTELQKWFEDGEVDDAEGR